MNILLLKKKFAYQNEISETTLLKTLRWEVGWGSVVDKIPIKTGSQVHPSHRCAVTVERKGRSWATAVGSAALYRTAPLPRCVYFGLTEQLLPKISSCQLLCVTGNLKHSWVHDKDGTRWPKPHISLTTRTGRMTLKIQIPRQPRSRMSTDTAGVTLDTRDTGRMEMVFKRGLTGSKPKSHVQVRIS